ncbi:MAG: HDIG domain-containing protein [Desulfomonile tiedjei]|uniref:HDIG domain-containing protein n=1 Tax=Desulfomonile tiedjei TaxID=2358 RepID=A0A9D6V2K7_9BACT|nr:HDIG domain-containing protein [Desulfomonile tiedjei]
MSSAKWGINQDEAVALMEQYLHTESMRKHCVASEAIMRELAPRFNADPDMWGLIGLLHDVDYNDTKDKMDQHALLTERILLERGVAGEIAEAIKYHNAENLGLTRSEPIHFALTAAETMTGMIVAAALVNPDKKLSSVKVKSVKKRMKAKEFARSVNREHILLCEQIGIPLEEFIEISLVAMCKISERMGL